MSEPETTETTTAGVATATTVPPPPVQDPSLKGVVGLQNMGSTCYANSVIQLLRAIPEWNAFCIRESFEDCCPDKDSVPAKILLAYQDLLRSMWSAYRPAYVRPMGFLSTIRYSVKNTLYDYFGKPMQNDSHEYLVYLLDNFHEGLNEQGRGAQKEEPKKEEPAAELTQQELAKQGWASFVTRHKSPVVDLFFGMMRKMIVCDTCSAKSYQWETFNVYKVPCDVVGGSLIEWCRNECKTTEILGYACSKCKEAGGDERPNAKIYSHIWQLPSSLFVSLRRFQPDGRKTMTACSPVQDLISFTDLFAPESDHPSKTWRYECRGIADHHGSHSGGHYSAQIAHPVTNQWWWMDDAMSAPLLTGPRFGVSNYILYFRRKEVVAAAAEA